MIAGSSFMGSHHDIVILKTSKNGVLSWVKYFGGTSDEMAYSGSIITGDSLIVTGRTTSYGNGNSEILAMKLDSFGYIKWAKAYGGNKYDEGSFIRQIPSKNIYLVGRTESYGLGKSDVIFLKLSNSGSILWSREYGGTLDEKHGATNAYINSDNSIIIPSHSTSFNIGNGNSTDQDIYLIKTDVNGLINCNYRTATPGTTNVTLTTGTYSLDELSQNPTNSTHNISSTTRNIISLDIEPHIDLGADTSMCLNNTMQLNAYYHTASEL